MLREEMTLAQIAIERHVHPTMLHRWPSGLDYFGENATRMRYSEFATATLPLGSGMVKGGCKQVAAAREKNGAMNWRRKGAHAIASLRAVHRSGAWARQPHMRRPTRP